MRIAIIVRSLKYGGMERAACNQADAFYLAGHKADLIYFSNKAKELQPKEKGVGLIHLDLNSLLKKSFKGKVWDLLARVSNAFLEKLIHL